jgi:hypothetical protein
MFILPEHKEKMTRALTTVGEIYGIYYGKEKSLKDLEEIYKRHRKLIKNCPSVHLIFPSRTVLIEYPARIFFQKFVEIKKGKTKMYILPEHKEKMTRALTIVGQIYGIYYGKEKSLGDLEEIYKRHRKLIRNCYLS